MQKVRKLPGNLARFRSTGVNGPIRPCKLRRQGRSSDRHDMVDSMEFGDLSDDGKRLSNYETWGVESG